MLRFLVIFALFTGLAACREQKTPVDELTEESAATEVPDNPPAQSDTLEETPEEMRCIDASMLELLGSEGQSKKFVERLKSFGFTPVRNGASGDASTLHFRNAGTQKDLIRTLEKLPEGGYTETVRYGCTPALLACFEASINREYYARVNGLYRSKGTGSYVYRTFRIDRSACEVIYTEHVGKEVSTPPVGMDSLYLNMEE